jgi:TRAP transporter 4TM/12TM fusion protein
MAIVATLAIMLILDIARLIKDKKIKKLADLEIFIPVLVFLFLLFGCNMELEKAGLLAGIFYILVALGNKKTIDSGKLAVEAIEAGMKNSMGVIAACSIAGIVAGVVSTTGLAKTLLDFIKTTSNGNLFIALFMTMIACIILGMGVPTTANYLIMATITAPILIKMGIPVLAAHMFVFYFGIVADITPPVALAAYAGSAIAGSNPLKTGVTATRLAIAAFVIPYIFAFNPKMLFIEASALDVVLIILTSCIGIFALSAALEGFMLRHLKFYESLPLVVGGLLMIYPGHVTDLIGFVIVAIIVVVQVLERRHDKKLGLNK